MKTNRLNIIGITVCAGYSPILALTLEQNTKKLKHIYVITKKSDTKTINICKNYNNVTVLYHSFKIGMEWFDVHQKRFNAGQIGNAPDPREEYRGQLLEHANIKAFNKSGGLRLGQQKAEEKFPDDFYLVLDCDVIISDDITNSIQSIELTTNVLYTARERRDYSSYKDYKLQQNWQRYTGPNIAGFFQLYKNNPPIYYDDWNTVTNSDMWFAKDIILNDWKNKVKQLPAHVDHLGSSGMDKYYQGSYEFDFKF